MVKEDCGIAVKLSRMWKGAALSTPLYQIDAFTSEPFAGNPAAVCLLPAGADPDATWMQAVAREMNLSETAFVAPRDDGFSLRWFTPMTEVDLCGHATLAAAHALWEHGALRRADEAKFHTASGLLTASSVDGWIQLDFPALDSEPADAPTAVRDALGIGDAPAARAKYDWLLEAPSEQAVRAVRPDFTKLRETDARGVIVTAPSDDDRYDFVSRFFAPGAGIDEDPVTGSAHCVLAPYWAGKLGKKSMIGYQASERGGVVRVALRGDRVALEGQAITVFVGDLRI